MKRPPPAPRDRRRAATLVEVMASITILAVLAIGVGGYLAYSRALLSQQRDRRVALEIAGASLEELRSVPCDQLIRYMPRTASPFYPFKSGGCWTGDASPRCEARTVNTAPATLTTYLQFDPNGTNGWTTNPYDHVVLSAIVTCGIRTTNRILLQTYYAPQP